SPIRKLASSGSTRAAASCSAGPFGWRRVAHLRPPWGSPPAVPAIGGPRKGSTFQPMAGPSSATPAGMPCGRRADVRPVRPARASRREAGVRDEARFGKAARTGRLAAAEGGIGFGGGGGAIGSEEARTFARLAAWYAARYGALATALDGRWKRDVVGAFRGFQDDGV